MLKHTFCIKMNTLNDEKARQLFHAYYDMKASGIIEIESFEYFTTPVSETETWNSFHGQLEVPKGTFDKIWNDKEGEENE